MRFLCDAARFTLFIPAHSTTIFKLCTGQKQLEEEIYNRYKVRRVSRAPEPPQSPSRPPAVVAHSPAP